MSQLPPEYGVAQPLYEPPRSPKWPWVLVLISALIIAGATLFGASLVGTLRQMGGGEATTVESLAPVTSSVAPATRVVVFEVTGTGPAFNITATVGTSVQNEASVRLPWSRTVEVPADELSKSVLLVVVAGPDGAEVHGKYTIDGTTVREGKASGPYGVLTLTDR
ncbi:hypothetical protein ACIA8G_07025 [Lentzea sp. NPDC051213]|uniref:hypothetical protein n=1 Tax=Lentzea sp. NPDC051213 TaxID=3364126 RepID=UPI0037BE09C2